MNEEPKARPSINLDELERQLREASRNQAFRKAVPELNVNANSDPLFLEEDAIGRQDRSLQAVTDWPDDTLSSKAGIGSRVKSSAEQNEADLEFRGPPPFLTGSRDDRFPEVGSNADNVTRSRSLRSISLIAFFCLLTVAAGYGFLHLGRDVGGDIDAGNVPVIKPDPNPARIKAEQASDSGKSPVGQELFSPKNGSDDNQAVVVTSKEQPVDLNAKKLSEELQSTGLQSHNGTGVGGQTQGSGGSAANVSEATVSTHSNIGIKSVRTVRVRADGTIIDPTGNFKSTPTERSNDPAVVTQNSPQSADSAPKIETNQNPVVSVASNSESGQGQSVSLLSVPLPPVRPAEVGLETTTGDPIESVSGLLANAQDTTETNSPGGTGPVSQTFPSAGLYSVQFGAPATEGEARALIDRVKSRMGESLATSEFGVFKGENSGKTVFRVRVVNISKADAQSLCERYFSLGGQCFVTRN